MGSSRTSVNVLALGVVCCGASSAEAQVFFTDWKSVDSFGTHGTIADVPVSIASSLPTEVVFAKNVLNGQSTWFDREYFEPRLARSDLVQLKAPPIPASYLLEFDRPVVDPVFHLQSLAATLTFCGINPVKISGQQRLVVIESHVIGDFPGDSSVIWNDANGTVMLPGRYSSIAFTAQWAIQPPYDGLGFQLGAAAVCPRVSVTGDQRLCSLGTATFVAFSSGTAPFVYQWQTQDPVSGEWSDLSDGPMHRIIDGVSRIVAMVAGAHEAELDVAAVGMPGWDGALFRCVVGNSCGTDASPAAGVFVCRPDFTCDGFLDFFDYDEFVIAYETGGPGADFNADGFLDFFDYDDFVTAFEIGC